MTGTPANILCKYAYVDNCQFLDIALRGLGLKSNINIEDLNLYTRDSQDGNSQVMINSFSPVLPNEFLLTLVASNPLNLSKNNDPKMDDYQKVIASTLDPAERRKVVWGIYLPHGVSSFDFATS